MADGTFVNQIVGIDMAGSGCTATEPVGAISAAGCKGVDDQTDVNVETLPRLSRAGCRVSPKQAATCRSM